MMKRIAILGSTGSIGTQTLDVISRFPETFSVEGLAAGSNIPLLLEQIRRFRPKIVSVADRQSAEEVKRLAPSPLKVVYGEDGLVEVAAGTEADMVVTAVVGSRGLKPTLSGIEAGKDIGLANKETLVSAGHLIMETAQEKGIRLLPIDSEHSAIFQCLQCLRGEQGKEVAKITLTASGGAFRDRSREELKGVSVEDALKHPNWSMGAKITIDSATMVNKGLEVIEAHWLFGVPYSRIEVLIHPESIVHSLVEFVDHSVIAQMGTPDMRVPIQYALTYPQRVISPAEPLDLAKLGTLHFRPADFRRYPCLKLAYECGMAGGLSPTVFNAANEMAVARFLKGDIDFLKIEEVIYRVVERHENVAFPSLQEILQADAWAREMAAKI